MNHVYKNYKNRAGASWFWRLKSLTTDDAEISSYRSISNETGS